MEAFYGIGWYLNFSTHQGRRRLKKKWQKNAETAGCISSLFRVIQAIVANNEKWTLQTNC
jgi:hypothetical protein